MECVICKVLPLVPRFDGEEDDRCEITNLPATEGPLAPMNPLLSKNFDPPNCAPEAMCQSVEESPLSIVDVPMGCAKLIEGAETHRDKWVVLFSVVGHFEPTLAVGTWDKGQVVESTYGGGGFTWTLSPTLFDPQDGVVDALVGDQCVVKQST